MRNMEKVSTPTVENAGVLDNNLLQWLFLGGFISLLHHFYTTAALSLMEWHGVL